MYHKSMQGDGNERPRLDVGKSLLQWAMNRSGKSVDELSGNSSLVKLREWMTGTRKPTMVQLEAFARATYTPFGHLLLSEPPQDTPSPIPHFRTINDNKPVARSIDLEDIIKILEYRQEWIRDYLIDIGVEPLEFVGSCNMHDDPVEISKEIKTTLGLAPDWAADHHAWDVAQKHLLAMVENARIFVSKNSMVQNNTSRLLDPEEFRGLVLVDKYAPFVFINGADVPGAQMFTLAHELAHVWMGKSASFDLHDLASPDVELEVTCNRVAAEFLVPADTLLRLWDEFTEHPDDPYRAASDYFKVSRIVAARRALDTGCILQKDFAEFYKEYKLEHDASKAQKNKKKGGPTPDSMARHRAGNRFLQTVFTAVAERKLLYTDAYYLTGLKSESFDKARSKMCGEAA